MARGGVEFQLPLTHAKIRQVAAEPPPELKRRVINNLRQLAAAADQYYLEYGTNHVTYDDLVGPSKYVKKMDSVDGEEYQGLKFAQGEGLEVKTSQGFVISYSP